MIRNLDDNRIYGLSQSQWDEIIDRYFEAETTAGEEKMLMRFLATPQAGDRKYDEIKAVMGYVAVGKSIYDKKKKEPISVRHYTIRPYRWVAAVAIGLIVGAAGWKIVDNQQNVCVAYIGGEKYTDPQTVMAQVRQSLHSVGYEECKGTVDDQLNDMFATISDNNLSETNEE